MQAIEGDVLVDPLERHHLVHDPQVLRVRIVLSVRKVGQVEEAVSVEPVFDGNEDNVLVLLDICRTLLPRFGRGSGHKGAAMDPYDDGLLFSTRIRRFPHIQIQAFLTRGVKGADLQGIHALVGDGPEIIRLVYAVIRNGINRGLPAVFTDGLPADKGNAPEGNDVPVFSADKGAVFAFNRKGPVVISIRNLFVFAVQGPHTRGCFLDVFS